MKSSRRDVIKGAAAAGLAGGPVAGLAGALQPAAGSFVDVRRAPDVVRVWGAEGEIPLQKRGESWEGGGVEIRFVQGDVTLRASVGVTRLALRWRGDLNAVERVLGDHWERSYADLAWRGREATRPMPWYFMANDGKRTHGYGVRTAPGAMC
ncbi:MAG: twin-arginine translocation signal domain-containing protein, partial [Methylobacterium sp.]